MKRPMAGSEIKFGEPHSAVHSKNDENDIHENDTDAVIIPPNAPHMYKNIQEPFRYLVIQTP